MTIQIGDVVGDYKVIGAAGTGGMGAVYRIEHNLTKRVEAMKLLPPGASGEPGQAQRFEREIQVQARLSHPNIVALYNAVRVGGEMALIMEFIEGDSLETILEDGALPLATAINYVKQILNALEYAHTSGVIHRDVAPANIIITPEGVVKLTDFGLARAATDCRVTSAGVPIGSPWYMSPEQVRGIGEMDHRTDIYAVGAVLYEMLTGGKLYDTDGAFSVMRAQVEAAPVPLSKRNPAIPESLEAVVLRALAKDPAMRFQSAREFCLDVEAAVGASKVSEPIIDVPAATPPAPAPVHAKAPGRKWWSVLPVRTALYFTIVPVTVLLCFGAVRTLHKAAPVAPKAAKRAVVAPAAPVPEPPAAAAPAPAAEPSMPVTTPVAAAPEPQPAKVSLPAKRPPAPAVRPAAAPAKVEPPPPVVQAPPRAARPAVKPPQRSYAIQVTGAEIAPGDAPVAPAPAARPAPAPPVSERATPEPVAAPTPAAAQAEPPSVPPAAPAAGDNDADKSAKGGNRFVRAIGKIFKNDGGKPARPAEKKD